MLGGNQLGRQVLDLVERWVPTQVHNHESRYKSELQEYLDAALNDQQGRQAMGFGMGGGGQSHFVDTERGTAQADVVVDDVVGVELKRNFTNSQQRKLRGQLDTYADKYDMVIACTCGIEDMSGWRELEKTFRNRQQGIMDPTQFAFVIKQRKNMGGQGGSRSGGDRGGEFGGDGLF